MGRLSGKTALITGAGAGLGRGVALRFADEGADIVVAERHEEPGRETVALIEERGAQAMFVLTDVGVPEQARGAVERTIEAFGRIDVLVNNAQGFNRLGRAEERTDRMWEKSITTGVYGTVWTMNAAFPHMKAQGGGRIINFGSIVGTQGDRFLIEYSAAKEAIRGLSRSAANEWGEHNILVNVICPIARTPSWDRRIALDPQFTEGIIAGTPLGRMGDPERDVGGAALFLASEDGCFVTGNTLFVDGGAHLRGQRAELP